jgi:serine/threonine-protein kinase
LPEPIAALSPNASLQLPGLATKQGLESADFTVVEVIRGGMGVCVRVRHDGTGQEYALKSILPSGLERELAYRRFVEEIKIWITLSSNGGIVPAFCIERVNEVPCVCSKWMKHGSLRRFLSVKSPQLFFETIDRIARTLGWAWDAYLVVHRDLKPDNLLFNSKDWPHVADWGIARTVLGHRKPDAEETSGGKGAIDLGLTMPGSFLGTLPYASPEQLIDATSADQRSDIYSLGCIMFEWERGTPPFYEGSPQDIARAHLYKVPPQLGGWLSKSSFGAEKVVAKCLEKRPEDRFQSYDELTKALAEASRRRKVLWKPIPISQSPLMPRVGWDQFGPRLAQDPSADRSKDGRYAVIEGKDYEPFLREADALMGVGEWQKAANILGSHFVPEITQRNPDLPYLQAIAVNYANCLMSLGQNSEAVKVLQTILPAKSKPAEFFVSYSNTLNHARKFRDAEVVAREGLQSFPSDKDILGNLTISLRNQGKLAQAAETAIQRLKLGKDIHSLEEMASVLADIGNTVRDADYPSALKHYADGLDCLQQVKAMNPRYMPARFSLARAWFDLEEYARSSKELNEIALLGLSSAYAELWAVQKAECMDRASLFDECREHCDKWLQKFPNSTLLKRIRAESMTDYFIGKEKDGIRLVEREALEFFTDVVARPDRRRATDFIYLARIKEWIGKVEEAFALLDEADRLAPNEWETAYCRALNYWRLEDFQPAHTWAQKACARGPWNPKSYITLSMIHKSKGMDKEAQEYERRADAIAVKREELRKSAVTRHDHPC